MVTLNGVEIKPTLFPDGTSQVWKLPDELIRRRYVFVKWDFQSEQEFLVVAQLKDLLDHNGIDANLELSYLPYGRQDKQVRNDQTFALRTFARLLNCLGFNKVYCLDPHSEVAGQVIKNFHVIQPVDLIQRVIDIVNPDVICYPDKGARDRYSKIIDFPSIYAEKQRNQDTGEIENLSIIGNPIDQKILIVDDLCDGGATFIRLANMLHHLSPDVNLYVTHGLFTKGVTPLFESGIRLIFDKRGRIIQSSKNDIQGDYTYIPYQELK